MDKRLFSSLWKMIEPIIEPEGIELVDLEFKNENGRWVLRLYVDTAEGITLDECERVSRQVSALMDMEDPIEQAYTLEVSSPGINRVLRKKKDFIRYAGSPVKIKTSKKLSGRRNYKGMLKGVDQSQVRVDVDGALYDIPLDEIETARLDLPESELFRDDLRR